MSVKAFLTCVAVFCVLGVIATFLARYFAGTDDDPPGPNSD